MGLELSNIYKEYEINRDNEIQLVLNGVNLTIADGEMIAIMGKSGAGKSTLLHIIGLLDVCNQGTYKLDGEDISDFTNKQRAKIRNEKIGVVLQDFGLVEDETVMENVSLPLMLSRTSMKKIREVALEKMKKVGVEHLSNKKVSVLSGGEKQRVAIARALVCDPEYIMADEPTGALDSVNAEKIMLILSSLNKEGKTVIIVTHDETVAKKCGRIITIKDGKIE
ncbi:ABC transporter ATP-binding protein [uncultured Eubacterium sp.]|jgi:putative ABC transport system ATP-binding protein|uniref:ABC transporter ATP-binding protein n=1 Tax=Eubacterium sp. TaxID=142586 RepID=UPI0025EFF890|nr:ABC transporter ATP-binding protein [uncultured Eubacterium sp.]